MPYIVGSTFLTIHFKHFHFINGLTQILTLKFFWKDQQSLIFLVDFSVCLLVYLIMCMYIWFISLIIEFGVSGLVLITVIP